MLEPELNLLCGNSIKLSLELHKPLCSRVPVDSEGGVEDMKLLRGASGAVVLSFELAEAGESFPTMLEPFGDLCRGDSESSGKLCFLLERGIRIVVESSLECVLLCGGDTPL